MKKIISKAEKQNELRALRYYERSRYKGKELRRIPRNKDLKYKFTRCIRDYELLRSRMPRIKQTELLKKRGAQQEGKLGWHYNENSKSESDDVKVLDHSNLQAIEVNNEEQLKQSISSNQRYRNKKKQARQRNQKEMSNYALGLLHHEEVISAGYKSPSQNSINEKS